MGVVAWLGLAKAAVTEHHSLYSFLLLVFLTYECFDLSYIVSVSATVPVPNTGCFFFIRAPGATLISCLANTDTEVYFFRHVALSFWCYIQHIMR